MHDEGLPSLVATANGAANGAANEETSLETTSMLMGLVENVEHVDLTAEHIQDTIHSTSHYQQSAGMHDSEDLEENRSTTEYHLFSILIGASLSEPHHTIWQLEMAPWSMHKTDTIRWR